jgi:hypothetical protein
MLRIDQRRGRLPCSRKTRKSKVEEKNTVEPARLREASSGQMVESQSKATRAEPETMVVGVVEVMVVVLSKMASVQIHSVFGIADTRLGDAAIEVAGEELAIHSIVDLR